MPSSTDYLSRSFQSSPLRHARFRLFYLGAIGTALGYTMQSTVAAWLMATLTPSALMVALVQTASTMPGLLFGLLGGVLADIVDRRRLLLVTQIVLLAATAALAAATIGGALGPVSLLALTFLIGLGFTFYMPAQQATSGDLVPRAELPAAVALGAIAMNLARAVGPALAGAMAAWLGSASALVASAACFVVMMAALRGWQSAPRVIVGVPETLLSGLHSGLRYARHSPLLRALIVRNLSFTCCASALWALMPVIARDQFGSGAGGFGSLLAAFGAGAVAGGSAMPRNLRRFPLDAFATAGVILWVGSVLLLAVTPIITVALVGACGAGVAWVSVLASLSAGIQSSAPAWVRARAVSMGLVAVQASLALGSVAWGWLASVAGTQAALLGSAALMMVLLALNRVARISLGNEADVLPRVQLPDVAMAFEPQLDDGPVLVQIEYRVEQANQPAFLRAIYSVESVRRRNGATSWRIFRDLENRERFVERYIVASWAEYVRLRARLTIADQALQQRVEQLQRPQVPVRISRLLGVGPASAEAAGPAAPGVPRDGEPLA